MCVPPSVSSSLDSSNKSFCFTLHLRRDLLVRVLPVWSADEATVSSSSHSDSESTHRSTSDLDVAGGSLCNKSLRTSSRVMGTCRFQYVAESSPRFFFLLFAPPDWTSRAATKCFSAWLVARGRRASERRLPPIISANHYVVRSFCLSLDMLMS
jgi:hypothetical protein